jgi:hypothetical protein
MPVVNLNDSPSYGSFLDTLVREVGGNGTTEVTLEIDGDKSATFRVSHTDLYIHDFKNDVTGGWVQLSSLNYMHMASPETVSRAAIKFAVIESATWAAVDTQAKERRLKLLIFVISEAARFMPVRFAVNRAISQGHTFNYADFDDILHSWNHLREAVGRAQIRVADVEQHLGTLVPSWGDSEARGRLRGAHILF